VKGLLARWDASPEEQAELSFGEVLTLVNLRRVEIACLLGIFTKSIELWTGYRPALMFVEIPMMITFLVASLVLRHHRPDRLAAAFAWCVVGGALFTTQWGIAALAAQGRLTSGYPTMLLSLTMLFVAPPRQVVAPLVCLLISYCVIVLTVTPPDTPRLIAIANAVIVTVISFIATALIHAARRRDYEQKREIRLQNALLVERNDELDALMAITAHDLRSPLYGLRNLFDLAVRRAPAEPQLPLTVLGQAIPSLDAMLALATRLLDAHAAEQPLQASLVSDDVRGQLLAAAERIAPLAQSAEIAIVTEIAERPLVALHDAGSLAQILDNLLSNAVRFSPSGSVVQLSAAMDGPLVAIRVSDNGPGIDSARRGLLFKRFQRTSPCATEAMPNTALGLYIVATLAERIKAKIRFEPKRPVGSIFIVHLASGQGTELNYPDIMRTIGRPVTSLSVDRKRVATWDRKV
jgi:signal transduction histidine kinase